MVLDGAGSNAVSLLTVLEAQTTAIGDGPRVLMLGAAGGVAGATLALLGQHRLGRALLPPGSELLLLDRALPAADGPQHATPAGARWLAPRTIVSGEQLAGLIREHQVDEVIDLAEVGTYDCVEACAREGASFLNTAFDVWPHQHPPGSAQKVTMIRAQALFEPPDVDAGVHLLCMGMNPGLINLLVDAGLRALAARSGRAPSVEALELHAILFTEIDGTTSASPLPPASERFASTWSPSACLEELLEPSAMITVDGEPRRLDHRPHEARYRARCGPELIDGFLVPHEELVTLGAMYPRIELAYLYRLPASAMASLQDRPERSAQDWETERLYPPHHSDLGGTNRVGALLCSRSLGELWIGWETPVAQALALGTNATLLQVATGVIAGWTMARELEPGVWLPEDLDGERILALAGEILGTPQVHWDPEAPALGLAERRC